MGSRETDPTRRTPDKKQVVPARITPPINAVELMGTTFEPLEYIVDQLITPGLTIIGSPPKSGKSFFVLGMLIAICQGIPFLGRETKRIRMAYFALEDSHRRIKARISMLLEPDRYEDLDCLTIFEKAPELNIPNSNGSYGFALTADNDFIAFLNKNCKSHHMIVVDVFQRIRKGSSPGVNLYESDYKEVHMLHRWAHENQVALILVHHFKKGSQGLDPVERFSGSTGISGAADTLITIERDARTDEMATFTVTGRDVPMQEFQCSFNNGVWHYEGTVEENDEAARRANYENNPIVRTIRHLLTKEEEVRITAGNLKKEMLELCEWEANGIGVDKRVLGKLRDDLFFNDRITYQYQESGGRWHMFERIFDD